MKYTFKNLKFSEVKETRDGKQTYLRLKFDGNLEGQVIPVHVNLPIEKYINDQVIKFVNDIKTSGGKEVEIGEQGKDFTIEEGTYASIPFKYIKISGKKMNELGIVKFKEYDPTQLLKEV